jgi:hydroxyacylglutathione hydrolase
MEEANQKQADYVFYCKTASSVFQNYVYAIVDIETRKAVLVDPVWEMETILQMLESNHLSLDGIFLTHAHEDHVHLAEPLHKHMQVPLWMLQKEIDYYNFRCSGLESFTESDTFLLGKSTLIEPIWTPGHTKGSTCFLANNALFTGDSLFMEGCGVCQDRGSSSSELFDSLHKIKSLLQSNTRIFPAHCYGKPVGLAYCEVLSFNIYLHFKKEQEFIRFRMRNGQGNIYDFK